MSQQASHTLGGHGPILANQAILFVFSLSSLFPRYGHIQCLYIEGLRGAGPVGRHHCLRREDACRHCGSPNGNREGQGVSERLGRAPEWHVGVDLG